MQFQKKFVILKDSNTICFDSGEGRIQIYNWRVQDGETSDTPPTILFEKACSLRDHQISEVIDTNLVSVTDFQFNGESKLFDVKNNRVLEYPKQLYKLNNSTGTIRSRTFASLDNAFSLSKNEQSLMFHFNQYKDRIEIINHDCIDFVFYNNKTTNTIKVVSFSEQNDCHMF